MPLSRRHRRIATWISLFVLVLASLAPGVSRALAFAKGDAWALGQVCSATASSRTDGAPAPAGDLMHAFEHCPFCALHSDGLVPPPAVPQGLAAPALSFALPALFLHAPRPLFAWAPAQARAPPLFV